MFSVMNSIENEPSIYFGNNQFGRHTHTHTQKKKTIAKVRQW